MAGKLQSTQMLGPVVYRAFHQLEILYYEQSLAVVLPYQHQLLDHIVELNFLRLEAVGKEYQLEAARPQLYDPRGPAWPPLFGDSGGLTDATPHSYC